MEEFHHMAEQASYYHRRNAAARGDTIQIVESELPITEAVNCTELAGVFLFRQLCVPCGSFAKCLLCNKTYPLMHRGGLTKHYYVRHGLRVVHVRARFDENVMFFHVPPEFDRLSALNIPCALCNTILGNMCDIFLHCFVDHRKEARFLPEPKMAENYGNFHCVFCEASSESFREHCDHLYFEHNRMIYCCKYCIFCTVNPPKLYRHMRCHVQLGNGLNFQCPACSVYLRGTDILLRHLRKYHTLHIGESEWGCRHCLSLFDFHSDLLSHLSFCPSCDSPFKPKQRQSSVSHGESCRCSICAEEHSMKQEIERLRGSLHISNTDKIDAAVRNKGDGIKEHIAEGIATKNSQTKYPEVNNCADGSGEASSVSLVKKVKDFQKEQTLQSVQCSSHNDSGIHIACGACLMYFDSEYQFAQHYCTEKAL